MWRPCAILNTCSSRFTRLLRKTTVQNACFQTTLKSCLAEFLQYVWQCVHTICWKYVWQCVHTIHLIHFTVNKTTTSTSTWHNSIRPFLTSRAYNEFNLIQFSTYDELRRGKSCSSSIRTIEVRIFKIIARQLECTICTCYEAQLGSVDSIPACYY